MNFSKIKTTFLAGSLMVGTILFYSSCKIDEIVDPNGPSVEGVLQDASKSDLQNLVSGIESGMRDRMNTYLDGVGIIGREEYRFSSSDPRFTSDLLGKGSATLDNNTFYTTRPFTARYRVVKNCNILIESVDNTTAVNAEEAAGYHGFAKTMQAYQLLLVLNMQYNNGIRVDVADPGNLGPFLTYSESLEAIGNLLDEAKLDLDEAGAEFSFTLSSGFADFGTPAEFTKLNRALAARAHLYMGHGAHALMMLDQSFMDIGGSMDMGAWHVFSTAGGDAVNEMFLPQNATSADARVAHPSFITDGEAGDARLGKATMRTETAFTDDLSSDYDFWVYTSQSSPISLIRNEELLLISAEAKILTDDLPGAVADLNIVRGAAGLGIYTGAMTEEAVTDQMLHERRYSLFGEGHRWVDMRRHNKLDELPIDRPGDDVWEEFPRPATEG